MNDDKQLREYCSATDEGRRERAFGQIVKKYAPMVMGVAVRRVGERELAEEISQIVFTQLARKAEKLEAQPSIGGWLHRATMLESAAALRAESRRKQKMKKLADLEETRPRSQDEWNEVLPKLDEAIHRLPSADRDLVLQHYFEGRTHAEIAGATGRTEAACAKQASRILRKLSGWLRRDGVVISASALGAGLATRLARTVPESLVKSMTHSALSVAGSAPAAAATAATPAFLQAMATTKLSAAAVLVAVGVSIPLTIQFAGDAKAGPRPAGPAIGSANPSGSIGKSPEQNEGGQVLRATGAAGTTEVDLAALARELEKFPLPSSDIERELEIQVLMFQLAEHQVADVLEILKAAPDANALRRVTRAVFARWAEFNPEAAVKEGIALGNGALGYHAKRGALSTWIARAPDAAFKFAVENYSEEFHIADMFEFAIQEMALRDPAATVERALTIEDDRLSRQAAEAAMNAWSHRDADAAWEWAGSVESDGLRTAFTGQIIDTLSTTYPDRALELALSLDHQPSRVNGAMDSIREWAFRDPEAAADAYIALPADVRTPHLTKNLSMFLVKDDAERALSIAFRLPEGDARAQFEYMAAWTMAPDRAPEAAALAESLPSGWQRKNALRRIGREWLKSDREAAVEWIDRTGALTSGELKKALEAPAVKTGS